MNFIEGAFKRLLREKIELIFNVIEFDLSCDKHEESITLDLLINKNESELLEEIMTLLVEKYNKLLFAGNIDICKDKVNITGHTTKFSETVVSGKFNISKELLTYFLDILNIYCKKHQKKHI